MVAPTYFLACRMFEDNGFASKMRAVDENEDGCELDFLEGQLRIDQDDQSREEFYKRHAKVRSTLI